MTNKIPTTLTYTIELPDRGRSCYGALRYVSNIKDSEGKPYIFPELAEAIIRGLEDDRSRIDSEAVAISFGELNDHTSLQDLAPQLQTHRAEHPYDRNIEWQHWSHYVTTMQNLNRIRTPWRFRFNQYETIIHVDGEPISVVFRGSPHEQVITSLPKRWAHAKASGEDEYRAMILSIAHNGNNQHREWPSIYYDPKTMKPEDMESAPMGIVTVGAFGLKDPTIHVTTHPPSVRPDRIGDRIIDASYEPIYRTEMPSFRGRFLGYRALSNDPTTKLEGLCAGNKETGEPGKTGEAIVNQGNALREINEGHQEPRLVIGDEVGNPVKEFSETLFYTTVEHLKDPLFMKLAQTFNPISPYSDERNAYISEWYNTQLSVNLGNIWEKGMPPVDDFTYERRRGPLWFLDRR